MRDLEEVLDQHFLEKRQIFLFGDIEEEIALDIIQKMLYMGESSEDISLIIHSEGGCVDAASAIIDCMISLQTKLKISTIALGKTYSAAANILTCGTKGMRYATQNSNIMFHPISVDLSGDYVSKQTKVAEFSQQQNDRLTELIAKNCGKKKESFAKLIEDGLWLSAKDAVKMKIIDKIVQL